MAPDHPPTPPTDETILAHLLGDPDVSDAASVPSAQAADPALAVRVGRLRRMLDDLATAGSLAPMFAVSAAQRERLRRVADPAVSPTPSTAPGGLARVARLVLDSFAAANPALGFRGAVADRLVRFESTELVVDMKISAPSPDEPVSVLGELLPAGPALIALSDLSDHPIESTHAVGDDGFFEFAVVPGRYRLTVETPMHVLDLGIVGFGATPPATGPGGR